MKTMTVTDIYGSRHNLGELGADGDIAVVTDALIHCEAGEWNLSFKTARPQDFYVGQEVYVNIFVTNPDLD